MKLIKTPLFKGQLINVLVPVDLEAFDGGPVNRWDGWKVVTANPELGYYEIEHYESHHGDYFSTDFYGGHFYKVTLEVYNTFWIWCEEGADGTRQNIIANLNKLNATPWNKRTKIEQGLYPEDEDIDIAIWVLKRVANDIIAWANCRQCGGKGFASAPCLICGKQPVTNKHYPNKEDRD